MPDTDHFAGLLVPSSAGLEVLIPSGNIDGCADPRDHFGEGDGLVRRSTAGSDVGGVAMDHEKSNGRNDPSAKGAMSSLSLTPRASVPSCGRLT